MLLVSHFLHSKKLQICGALLNDKKKDLLEQDEVEDEWVSAQPQHGDAGGDAGGEPKPRAVHLWYTVDVNSMQASHASVFLPLGVDDETEAFLARCFQKADWVFTQLWHTFAKSLLSIFMSQTSVNGLLRRGSMFVCSRGQFIQLLGTSGSWRAARLLDLGAGDGAVTDVIAPHFTDVSVTEMSSTMRQLLASKNYTVLDTETWHDGCSAAGQFDVITCLNLLDRCDRPIQLLHGMRRCVRPDGVVLVAIVLPVSPYVEHGVNADHSPAEPMQIDGSTFIEQVSSLIEGVFKPAGFQVVRWSRLPYLCEGDLEQAFYWLNDAIFVLRPQPPTEDAVDYCPAVVIN